MFSEEPGKDMLKIVTLSDRETFDIGKKIAGLLCPGDILCLFGELGAGKTKFAQGVAAGLGVREQVTSPTFVLIREYEGRLSFYHMDAYRLSGHEDMEDLGYEEYFYGDGVTLLEWADRVKNILPGERLDIVIDKCFNGNESYEESCRIFTFKPHGKRYFSLVREYSKLALPGERR